MSFYESNIEWTKDLEIKYENCDKKNNLKIYGIINYQIK